MERWRNCVAVVTRASSGIVTSIAKDLTCAVLRVVAMARREERLEKLKESLPQDLKFNFFCLKCGISSRTSIATAFD